MKGAMQVFDSAMKSEWVRRIKDGKDFLLLVVGTVASIVLLLRQPAVQISYSYFDVLAPREASREIAEISPERALELPGVASLIRARSMLKLTVRNSTSQPIDMRYISIVGVERVVDYAVDWGGWSGLVPSARDEVLASCCPVGSIQLPFLSTLPPRSSARISMWFAPASGFPPQVLAKAENASVAIFSDVPASRLAAFIDDNKVRLSAVLLLFLLWKVSGRIAAFAAREVQ